MSSRQRSLRSVALMCLAALTGAAHAVDSREDVDKTVSKPLIRGGIVYRNYCQLCHGEQGDGQARATKLYEKLNLTIISRTSDYYSKIVSDGGKAVGRSEFMPAWRDELSAEQMGDVIEYLSVISNPVGRGKVVFNTYCILCHGVKGDGKGRASVLYNPPPADLTHSDKNDDYKRQIITLGGKAMGRSEVMPPWSEQLSTVQINDLVEFLRTLLQK